MAFSDATIVLTRDSPKWRYMKKQVMAALKQHGDGLKNLEDKALICGEQMLKTIEQYKGDPFDPERLIHLTLANIIQILIFGQGSELDSETFIEDANKLIEALRPIGIYMILDIAPFLRYFVPPVRRAYTAFIDIVNKLNSNYDRCIMARRKLYVHPNVEVFIDQFFKLSMTQNVDAAKMIGDTEIRSLAADMFVGGSVTTSKTLTMMLAILVNHPEIQDAVFQEINDIIGKRQPRMEDKLSMPFTQAVILETLRYHSLAPFAVPHVAKYDSELQGYLIPAGTMVFPNVWMLHHDDRYWVNPWEFKPHRWLEGGKVLPPDHIKKQRVFPFGAGRRQCAGEVFARNRLFILTTLLLQKFKFVPAEGLPNPNCDPSQFKVVLMIEEEPYKLSAEPRY